jgi:hypothetical protein
LAQRRTGVVRDLPITIEKVLPGCRSWTRDTLLPTP